MRYAERINMNRKGTEMVDSITGYIWWIIFFSVALAAIWFIVKKLTS